MARYSGDMIAEYSGVLGVLMASSWAKMAELYTGLHPLLYCTVRTIWNHVHFPVSGTGFVRNL